MAADLRTYIAADLRTGLDLKTFRRPYASEYNFIYALTSDLNHLGLKAFRPKPFRPKGL